MYRFFEDPGHGWLEVTTAELLALGIADKISAYSYQSRDGQLAYLEEDCDFALFEKARNDWWKICGHWKIERIYQDSTFVRDLPPYSEGGS